MVGTGEGLEPATARVGKRLATGDIGKTALHGQNQEMGPCPTSRYTEELAGVTDLGVRARNWSTLTETGRTPCSAGLGNGST